jgi:leader peptidase (prepilin peptidase) / N-methyltransferase
MGYWLGLLVLIYFAVIVIIDFEHRSIMMVTVLFGVVLGLGVGIRLHGLVNTLLGGLVGLGIMGIFYLIGLLFARYRARKLGLDDGEEALGLGDVYIAIVLGLMLGWPRIMVGLMFGILAGGIVSLLVIIVLVLVKRYQSMTVFTAYGPYLVFGAFLLLYLPKIFAILSEK